MKEVKVKIYKFNELSKEVKEELIEKETQYQLEFYMDNFLYENLKEEANTKLKTLFKNVEINSLLYDFSCSQGSGLLIEFEAEWINGVHFAVKQNPNNWHYTFCRNFIVDYEDEVKREDEIDIKQIIESVNEEVYNYGYSQVYDEEQFKELAKERLEEDEEESYLVNGEIFKEGRF